MGTDSSTHKTKARDLALPLRILVGTLFGVIVVLTILQVFFRFVLDSPLIWSEELARLLLVWVTFLGAAVICWDGTHLNVDTLFVKFPLKMRRVARRFNAAVAIGFLSILVYYSVPLVEIEHMTTLGSLDLPGSLVRLPATVGGVLMIVLIVLRWVYRLPRDRSGSNSGNDSDREPM